MTNDDCLLMRNALDLIEQPSFDSIKDFDNREDYLFHAKFLHAIAWNKRKLDGVVETLNEANKNSKEYQEYVDERNKIIERYSIKDDKGAPLKEDVNYGGGMVGQKYVCPDMNIPVTRCFKELDDLKKKNKELIDNREKQSEEFKDLLKEDSGFVPKKVPFSMIPEGISAQSMSGVMFMIEDEDEPGKKEEMKKEKGK